MSRLAECAAVAVFLLLGACGRDEPQTAAPAAPATAASAEPAPAPPTLEPIAPEPSSPPTAKATSGYSETYETCMATGEAAQGVTPAMVACITDELARQDALLNAVYRGVLASRTPDQANALQQEERAWISTRDADCKAASQTGGTIDRLTGPLCHLDATIARTRVLEAMQ